jgi:hypothetical protein
MALPVDLQAAAARAQRAATLPPRCCKPAQVLEHTEGAQPTTMRKLTYEIVHVTKTQEQIENEDLVVDYHEIRTVNGNGHG